MNKTVLFLVVLFAFIASAQVKVVSFKKLQPFLPQGELSGFTRNKPVGQTQTVMGFSTSECSVEYSQNRSENDTTPVVSVKFTISDVSYMPMVAAQFAMFQQGYAQETEHGSQQYYQAKGKYPGRLSVENGESKSCKIEVGIMNRFMIVADLSGSDDRQMLEKLLEPIDLDKLAALPVE